MTEIQMKNYVKVVCVVAIFVLGLLIFWFNQPMPEKLVPTKPITSVKQSTVVTTTMVTTTKFNTTTQVPKENQYQPEHSVIPDEAEIQSQVDGQKVIETIKRMQAEERFLDHQQELKKWEDSLISEMNQGKIDLFEFQPVRIGLIYEEATPIGMVHLYFFSAKRAAGAFQMFDRLSPWELTGSMEGNQVQLKTNQPMFISDIYPKAAITIEDDHFTGTFQLDQFTGSIKGIARSRPDKEQNWDGQYRFNLFHHAANDISFDVEIKGNSMSKIVSYHDTASELDIIITGLFTNSGKMLVLGFVQSKIILCAEGRIMNNRQIEGQYYWINREGQGNVLGYSL